MKRGPTVWDSMSGMREQSNLTIILENEDCKVIRASGKDGEGIMTFYQVFEGVYLMYDDFHMSECISGDSPSENILCITHCREGRIEMHSDNGVVYYMEPGDLRVDDMAHHKGNCYFPLSHYHGVTIGFQTDYAEESLRREMPGFHFDLQALIRKFCGGGSPFVIHNEPAVEHLFYQLYQLPGRVQKEYFKIKVIELLLYLSGMETDPYKVERPYFYNGQVEKIRAIRDLITSDLTRTYTAEELSQRFSISLTAMKRCFRSTYGSPMYAYLKEHRLNEAAGLLITRRDLKISEVGALVGYESPSKFTAVFRERMGQTPLEYRKTHGMERRT